MANRQAFYLSGVIALAVSTSISSGCTEPSKPLVARPLSVASVTPKPSASVASDTAARKKAAGDGQACIAFCLKCPKDHGEDEACFSRCSAASSRTKPGFIKHFISCIEAKSRGCHAFTSVDNTCFAQAAKAIGPDDSARLKVAEASCYRLRCVGIDTPGLAACVKRGAEPNDENARIEVLTGEHIAGFSKCAKAAPCPKSGVEDKTLEQCAEEHLALVLP